MIRAIVVDDEKPSRELMFNYLKEFCSDVDIIATASSVKTGYKAIKKYNPDLVFLDIELGQGTGFDMLRMFDRINFNVVFVTAFSEHAIRAFRVNAIDYLLKPVKIDELKAAVEKAAISKSDLSGPAGITALIKSVSSISSPEPTLIIPHIKGFDVLKVHDIIMCKADGYCTEFYLTGKRKIISSKNLKRHESFLTRNSFFRSHNSYLININHVYGCTKQGEIDLKEGIKASLSDANRNKLMQILKSRNPE